MSSLTHSEPTPTARPMKLVHELGRCVGIGFGIGTQLLFLWTVVYLFLFLRYGRSIFMLAVGPRIGDCFTILAESIWPMHAGSPVFLGSAWEASTASSREYFERADEITGTEEGESKSTVSAEVNKIRAENRDGSLPLARWKRESLLLPSR